eukprot:Colp12_sorted_trinity150504_noHs@30241
MAEATEQSNTIKVFVGNLAFGTKEEEIKAHFASAGAIADCKIVRRGNRSLRFGFIDFLDKQTAEKAVATYNKSQLGGRPLNVELAKERVEGEERPPRERQPRERRAPRRRPARSSSNNNNPDGSRRPRNNRAPRDEAAGEGEEQPRRQRAPRRRRARRDEEGAEKPAGEQQPAADKPAAEARPPVERPPNTVYIGNLPFSMDEAALLKLFEGFNVKHHYIVKRANGFSKGYGFVQLADEAEQQKAQAAVDKKSVEGRELSVKFAHTTPPPRRPRNPRRRPRGPKAEGDAPAEAQQ